jgi:hypothetical protein
VKESNVKIQKKKAKIKWCHCFFFERRFDNQQVKFVALLSFDCYLMVLGKEYGEGIFAKQSKREYCRR